jgi:hypothetical protein
MDVKTTYLYDHLHEKIYIAQSKDCVDPKYKNKVCKGCGMNALVLISLILYSIEER